MNNLHVTDKPFSIEHLEELLAKCLPGQYKITWHTSQGIWDMKLNWTGTEFHDLYPKEKYND